MPRSMMRTLRRLHALIAVHLPILLRTAWIRLFPSFHPLLAPRPSAAWINPTDNCNLRCVMCGQWREVKKDELTTEEWKDAIRQIRDEGIDTLGLNGGEPLLRKDLAEIAGFASSLGMKPMLITNGSLLDGARLDELIGAGVRHVSLSIDGVGADYEKVRGREWALAQRAARLLCAAFHSGRVDANLAFVLMRETLGNLEAFRPFRRELGLPMIVNLMDRTPFFFDIPENRSAHWMTQDDLPALRAFLKTLLEIKNQEPGSVLNTLSDIEYMASYFSDPRQARVPCAVSQLRILIDSRGGVFGGCWSMGSFGSLRENRLREILASPRHLKARRAMFFKQCPGCSCGYTTNLRYFLPSRLRDLGGALFSMRDA
jgi:MoaA/NifB/PqqE/SkfB family radical SAM enzyme